MVDVCEFLGTFYDKFPVPSSFIGVVYDKRTKEIQLIINPAYDWQLSEYWTDKTNVLLFHRLNCPSLVTYTSQSMISDIIKRAKKVLK